MKKKLLSLALALVMCLGLTVPALAAERTIYLNGIGFFRDNQVEEFESKTEETNLSLKGDLERTGTVIPDGTDFKIPIYFSKGPVTATLHTLVELGKPVRGENENGEYRYDNILAYASKADCDEASKTYTDTTPIYFAGKAIEEVDADTGEINVMTIEEAFAKLAVEPPDLILDMFFVNGASLTLSEPGIYHVWVYNQTLSGTTEAYIHVGEGDGSSTDTPTPDTPAKPAFTDVAENSPFKDAIAWAVEQKITNGTSATTFGPSNTCTHNHILTFLWRANGSPASEGSSDFEKAIAWAKSKGLAETIDGGAACTRAQTMMYLWKLAGSPATEANGTFTDVPADADYAQAVAWAVAQGVTKGTSATTFGPDNTCTRGQIVTFLYRNLGK